MRSTGQASSQYKPSYTAKRIGCSSGFPYQKTAVTWAGRCRLVEFNRKLSPSEDGTALAWSIVAVDALALEEAWAKLYRSKQPWAFERAGIRPGCTRLVSR